MKTLKLLTKARFRLLALILCMTAFVPQLHADVTIFVCGTAPKLYVFNTDGTAPTDVSTSWSGVQMTESVQTSDGKTWYYVHYEGLNSCSIIFNNGSGTQTENITNVSGTRYYYSNGSDYYLDLTTVKGKNSYVFYENSNGWNEPIKAHFWNGNYSTNWSGDQMTAVGRNGRYGNKIYVWSHDTATPGMVIFNGNNGSNQTGNLQYRNKYYYYGDGNNPIADYANIIYPELPQTPQAPDYYVIGTNTDLWPNGWSTSNIPASQQMTESNGVYTWSVSNVHLDAGNIGFKVYDSNNNYHPAGSGTNININVAASGTYDLTITYDPNSADDLATYVLTPISVDPVTPHYYITGENNLGLGGFTCVPTLELTDGDNDGVYTYTTSATADGTYSFVFANGQGTSSSDWTNFNNNFRIGPTNGNTAVALNTYQSTQLAGGDNGAYQVTVAAGTVTFYLNPTAMTFMVEGSAPVITPDYYVVGDDTNIFPNGWNTGSENQMADNNGTYTWSANNVHLYVGTTYEYKVHGSDNSWYPSGNNATINVNASGTYNVLFTFDGTNVTAVPTLIQPDQTYNYTFYVLPDDGTTPTLYLWGTNNTGYHPNGDFPGTAMGTTEQLADENDWYKYTGALYVNLINAIVNNGGNGHQTSDITSLAPDTYYIYWNVNDNTYTISTTAPVPAPTYDYTIYVRYKGDGTPHMYTWNADGEPLGAYPGTELTDANTFETETINGYTYYKYVVTGSHYPTLSMNLNEGLNAGQTENLAVAPGTSYYTYGGGNTYDGPKAQADPAISYYVRTSFDSWTDSEMTSNGNGGYTKQYTNVALTAGNTYEYIVHGIDGTNNGVWIGDGNGGNVSFSPVVNGTYTVTITLNSDGTPSHTLTLTSAAPVYITGNGILGDFSYAPTTAMTYTSDGIYTYTATATENPSTIEFVFGNGQGSDWNDLNGNYRIGPTSDNETYTLNSGYTATQMAGDDHGHYSVTTGAGTVTFYLDVTNMQYKVEGTAPTYGYTFYVLPSDGNVTPYLYLWGANNTDYHPNGDWGSNNALSQTEQLGDYNTWYKLVLPSSQTNVLNAIVHNNDGGQTTNIENLAPGTYYIRWNTSDNSYTITTNAPGVQTYYITGSDELGLGWSAAPTTTMTYDPVNHVYTYSGNLATSGSYGFVFANGQGANANDWTNFNDNYRIGPTSGNESVDVNGTWHSTQQSHGDNGAYMVNLSNGPFTITFDPANNQFKVNGIRPIYITGEPGLGLSWEYAPPKLMTYDANSGYYTYTYDIAKEETYHFVFADGQGSGANDEEGWSTFNEEFRIGPTGDADERYLVGVDDWMSTQHASIPGGTPAYSYYAKMAKGTATIYFDYADGNEANMRFRIVTQNAASGDLYLIGGFTLDSVQHYYNANEGVLMKYDASKDLYYLNHVVLNNNSSFCFTTLLGNSNDDWANVGTRYGNNDTSDSHYYQAPSGEGQIGHYKVFSEKVNVQLPLDEWEDEEGEWKMYTAGIYNVVVSLDEGWVKLIKTDQFNLFPMNVYLATAEGCTFDMQPGNPNTTYDASMYPGSTWPLSAYNRLMGGWNPASDSTHYAVTYIGDTIAANNDGEEYDWWHWQVSASICELFFTDSQGNTTGTIERHAGVLWVVLNADGTFTDVTREHFDFAATSLPSNVVVDEGHCYVYFINTVGWQTVHFTAWDNDPTTAYTDADGNNLEQWPGQAMTCIGIDPETGYEVWEYDLGPIIEMGMHEPTGVLFNDGTPNATTDAKEQTGDAQYINGGVYDYLGLLDDAHSLSSLIHHGNLMVRYTVSDDLVGVYYDDDALTPIYDDEGHFIENIKGALYAKDMNNYPEPSIQPEGTYDYVYDICSAKGITDGESQIMDKKKSYDQSNWVKLIHSPNYDGGHSEPLPVNQRPYLKNYVGKIIPGGTLQLFMSDSINPTAHVLSIPPSQALPSSYYEPNVYVSGHFNDTVVYDYVHKDWQPKRNDGTEAYKGNHRYAPQVTWIYDNQTGDVLRGEVKYRPVDDINYRMFYVAPKPQEIAYLTWIVYDNNNSDQAYGDFDHNQYYPTTPVAWKLPSDPGRFYAPKSWDRSITIPGDWRWLSDDELTDSLGGYGKLYGPYTNGYNQYGAVQVNWSLFGDSITHDVTVDGEAYQWWQIFQPGQAYKIMAVIRYAHSSDPSSPDNVRYLPGNGAEGTGETTHPQNAPARAPYADNGQGGYANMYFTGDYAGVNSSKFIIFPLKASPSGSNGSDLGNVTKVKEVVTQREVASVRYYNLMGVESDKPFDGINIVVTTYSDGTRTSKKILR